VTWPPPGIDYPLAENTAFTTIRELSGYPLSWGEMVGAAQAVLTHADDLVRTDGNALYDLSFATPLIAAARILDAAADARSDLASPDRQSLGMLAVLGYAMHGNFLSASAVARREGFLDFRPGDISEGALVALAAALPNALAQYRALTRAGSPAREFLTRYIGFISTGRDSLFPRVRDALVSFIVDQAERSSGGSSFDSALLRLALHALEQARILSIPRVLRELGALDEEVVTNLVRNQYRVFLPPQYRAIAEKQLLSSSANSLIALPTSTGKTLLGSLCLLSALGLEPGLVCYVTPWVATARQAADALQKIKPSTARVSRLMGGFTEEVQIDPDLRPEIVVATPERMDGLLRGAPGLIEGLRAVVFDEAHLVQNDARGTRLEGIIARLRILQDREVDTRLILISAVLEPDPAVRQWLAVEEEGAFVDRWRPTARRLSRWSSDGRIEWFAGDDPVRRPGTDPDSVVGSAELLLPEPALYPTAHFGGVRKQAPLVHKNIAYLADWASRRLGTPILCICSTKAQTRAIAVEIAERRGLLEPLPPSIAAIRAAIDESYPYLRQLRDVLSHGVAFHNSTVPHAVRRLIEEAIAARDIQVVTSTTTLAEGVDLPFHVTLIADWLLFGATGQRPMSAMLFANVAGRAGRAGSFTDGDTILFDNPVGDPMFTRAAHRHRVQRQFFLPLDTPRLTSAVEGADLESREDLTAALASQFLAAIPENPSENRLGAQLLDHMLVSHRVGNRPDVEAVQQLLDAIESELLAADGAPLAVANSPITLTDLGRAVNRTGFAPRSAKLILRELRVDQTSRDLPTVSASLLRALGTLPEQPSVNVKKVLTQPRSRVWVKPDDFEDVIRRWIEGTPVEDMFTALPIVRRSSRRPPVEQWRSGEAVGPAWDEELDKFVEFVTTVVSNFLPWLFRACATLSAVIGGWGADIPWSEWADLVEQRSQDDPEIPSDIPL